MLGSQSTSYQTKVALIREYIEEGPVLFHQYIQRLAAELTWDYSSIDYITRLADAARNYTQACYALEATTDNLLRHTLENPDVEALTSALIQNKHAAWKEYRTAVEYYEARQRSRTRPLTPPTLNW